MDLKLAELDCLRHKNQKNEPEKELENWKILTWNVDGERERERGGRKWGKGKRRGSSCSFVCQIREEPFTLRCAQRIA